MRQPSPFQFGAVPPFHVVTQIVDVFLSHAEFDLHEELVIAVIVKGAVGRDDLNKLALVERPDERGTIERVSGKAVELPADDPLDFTAGDPLHHFVEDRPAGCLGGLGFSQHFLWDDPKPVGKLLQLFDLGFNGKHLLFLGFGGFAAIDEVMRHRDVAFADPKTEWGNC